MRGLLTSLPKAGEAIRQILASRYGLLVVLAIGTAMSFISFVLIYQIDRSSGEERFLELAVPRIASIKTNVTTAMDTISLIAGHFAITPPNSTNREDFDMLVASSLKRQTFIQALEWIAYVKKSDRARFETFIQAQGNAAFQITEKTPDGAFRTAQERDAYSVVVYASPLAGNERAIGYDLGSEPNRLAALTRARETNSLASTARIVLVQEKRDQYGILAMTPVFAFDANDKADVQKPQLRGYSLGVLRIEDLVNHAIGAEDPVALLQAQRLSGRAGAVHGEAVPQILFHVYDMSADPTMRQLYPKAQETPIDSLTRTLHAEATLTVGGRQWLIIASPSADFLKQMSEGNAYFAFGAGILMTILLAFWVNQGQQKLINAALRQTNMELEAQSIQLIKANQIANDANRAKSEFLSNMSHELRTPLNAIIGFAELLLNSKAHALSDRQQGQAAHILNAGEYLLKLINEILEFAKVDVGGLQVSVEPISVRHLVDEACNLIGTIITKQDVTLVDEVGDSVLFVMADRVRAIQILLNLLTNAAKYNRSGGTIRIWCRRLDSGMVRLAVADTGAGFDLALKQQLFEPFNRLGAEASTVEGSGLGLALTLKLAQLMGGAVDMDSVLGQGSTFWVDLPEAAKPVTAITKQNWPRSSATPSIGKAIGQGRVLLYIEDNPANVRLMEDFISEFDDWSVVVAHTAELGLDLAESRKPDLIICDINLPGMNGLEAVVRLRQMGSIGATLPILALSADATKKTVAEGLAAGFNDYLTKPIRLQDLKSAMELAMSATKPRV